MNFIIKKTHLTNGLLIVLALGLTACASLQQQFMDKLQAICGNSYGGKLVSTDQVDADMRSTPMVMQIAKCSDAQIRIPFHIGENSSRTWILSKTEQGLRLKHQHNHQDASQDPISQYGGDTNTIGTSSRQTFPVDDFSIELFKQNGLDASITNIWAMEVTDTMFAYELRRKNRHFRVEFDLTNPVADPGAPW